MNGLKFDLTMWYLPDSNFFPSLLFCKVLCELNLFNSNKVKIPSTNFEIVFKIVRKRKIRENAKVMGKNAGNKGFVFKVFPWLPLNSVTETTLNRIKTSNLLCLRDRHICWELDAKSFFFFGQNAFNSVESNKWNPYLVFIQNEYFPSSMRIFFVKNLIY